MHQVHVRAFKPLGGVRTRTGARPDEGSLVLLVAESYTRCRPKDTPNRAIGLTGLELHSAG